MDLFKNEGKIFVISGPSGSGKSTIANALLEEPDTVFSISMTTRKIREGEVDGVNYYFVTDEEYDRTVAEGGFLEHAEIYNHKYGTPKKPALENLKKGLNVILEIEMQGALQVKESYPDAVLIFVLPPSLKILRERIENRGTDSKEEIDKRMAATVKELDYLKDYDYYIVNDIKEVAVETVKNIMRIEKQKVKNLPANFIEEYIKE
ncbi:MAG: guanylate kinase [Clostridia bacterium]|nr:guanylate kinase [Clostridia bacterium]